MFAVVLVPVSVSKSLFSDSTIPSGPPNVRTPPCLPQALIYFAVSKKGEPPIDGVTDANPEGLTSTCGKWAREFKQRLATGGLTCHELQEDRYVFTRTWPFTIATRLYDTSFDLRPRPFLV